MLTIVSPLVGNFTSIPQTANSYYGHRQRNNQPSGEVDSQFVRLQETGLPLSIWVISKIRGNPLSARQATDLLRKAVLDLDPELTLSCAQCCFALLASWSGQSSR
jgi:hypothetical protein